MAKFLVENEVVVANPNEDGADPIELMVYSVVEANSMQDAETKIAGYGDSYVKVRINKITELSDKPRVDSLLKKMEHDKVVKLPTT